MGAPGNGAQPRFICVGWARVSPRVCKTPVQSVRVQIPSRRTNICERGGTVYAGDLKSPAERIESSNLSARTDTVSFEV